jgi:hypothetical protein
MKILHPHENKPITLEINRRQIKRGKAETYVIMIFIKI